MTRDPVAFVAVAAVGDLLDWRRPRAPDAAPLERSPRDFGVPGVAWFRRR